MRQRTLLASFHLPACCLALVLAAACHDEPTFVITFAPQDMTGAAATPATARVDAAHATTVTADGGASVAQAATTPTAVSATTATAEAIACKTAADCALAPAECCDCNNGGKQHVIAKAKAAAHEKARAAKCKGTVCNSMMSTDESCSMVAACVDGKCALAPAKK